MTNYVNSVQQVSITIASGATTGTATITAVTDTAVVFYQGNSTTATTAMSQALARVSLSGTTVTATRATASTNTCTVNVAIVDADSTNLIKSVQFGTIAITSGTTGTASISSVTTGNTVVAIQGYNTGNATFNFQVDNPVLALNSATVVGATIGSLLTSCTVGFCVIEFQGTALNQNTQFFSVNWTNNALTTTQAITSVNVANSMMIYAGSSNDNTTADAIDQQSVALTSSTVVTVSSGFADGDPITCNFWVVEFANGVLSQSAQRGTTALSAVTSNTTTITSAATALTLNNFCGWTSSITAKTSLATVLPRVSQTSATVITAAKNTGTGLTTTSWEALTFTQGGSGPVVNTLTALEGVFSLSGKAALLNSNRNFAAAEGVFTLAGKNSTFNINRKLSATEGVFSLSGKAAVLATHRRMAAAEGVFTLSGKNSILGLSHILLGAQGVYLLSGKNVVLTYNAAVRPVNPQNWVAGFEVSYQTRQIAAELQQLRKIDPALVSHRFVAPVLQQHRESSATLQQRRVLPPALQVHRKAPPTLT